MKLQLLKIFFGLLILAGIYFLVKILYLDIPRIETNALSSKNIPAQIYSVNNRADTLLMTPAGSKIWIPSNSFVDSKGKLIYGRVEIYFKEFLNHKEIILAGLSTMSNGEILESGGMFLISAGSKDAEVFLKPDAQISIGVRTDSIKEGMRSFRGSVSNIGINWIQPTELMNKPVVRRTEVKKWGQDDMSLQEAVNSGYSNEDTVVPANLLAQLIMDTSVSDKSFSMNSSSNISAPHDDNQYYFVRLSRLGWVNIDRFYNDPRTQPVELITKVKNYAQFGEINIRLVFRSQMVFVQGYQKGDKSYSFTHGDYELARFPVGEPVMIVASATKNDKSFFDMKSFVIRKNQMHSLELKETTLIEINKRLDDVLNN